MSDADNNPDSYISTDPDSGAQKEVKLERFDLIPVFPLFELARHYGRGAKKYDENQWRGGYAWWKSFRAAMTHLLQFWSGEDIDKQTGSPHLICVVWHCFTLLEYGHTCPDKDTRIRQPYESNVSDFPPEFDPSDLVIEEVTYTVFLEDWDESSVKYRTTVHATNRNLAVEMAMNEWLKIYPNKKPARLIQCIEHLKYIG